MKGCNIELVTAIRSIGLTQRELAEKINVTEQQVSRWVRNPEIVPHRNHRELLRTIGIDVYAEKEEK